MAVPPILCATDVVVRFGGIIALHGVSFSVPAGIILGLIGPNGSGKTTLFNCLSRLYTPDSGEITYEGDSILQLRPDQVASRGIGRTFQNVALFQTLTVLQNVMIGAHARSHSGFIGNALRLPSVRAEEEMITADAWELIEYLQLADVAHDVVVSLPFGTQKRVEMARALAIAPSLLLLDEPAGGLNHDDVLALENLVLQIRDERDVTILLVEHHMSLVMKISDYVVALDFGRKIAEGTPIEIQSDPEVIRAYLGTADHDAA